MKKKELKAIIKKVNEENALLKNALKKEKETSYELLHLIEDITNNTVLKSDYEILEDKYNQLMCAFQMEAIKSAVIESEMDKMVEKDCIFFEIERVIVREKKSEVIVIWKDGSKTVSKCAEEDTFDVKTGLMICLARRVYGENLEEVLLPYTYDPKLVNAMKNYINLDHPDYRVRSEAAKNWETLEKPMRQSVKDHLKNLAEKGLIEEVLKAKVKYC